MRTSDRILATALHLFNLHGTDSMTVRHIAREMGISHGNLCYHFPRTEDIIQQLYLNLVAELNDVFGQLQHQPPGIPTLLDSLRLTFAAQYRYRFLLLDFVRIMRRLPAVQAHFRQLYTQRREQLRGALNGLREAGILLPEQYPGQHDQLIAQFYLLGDFWIAEAEILFEGSETDKLAYYARVAAGLIYPHLTDRGRQELLPFLTSAAPQ
ncbi:TetR/AcrR family transcriptional regulator [Hymenobacter sp. BT175]|uniref:TetR/AcrR family transcriptional regulator n=1 Tax=Hymenobacter translucens TaxID=2886507 RepID=UPI001D0E774A|nr:TetR/AcrR family transcriptional regulator [Hymenobacter translucens]MCC2545618.1 TetR/AcrR family transcriptional regulator [Hymenobacter translucens]